ncbi:MAG: DNA polymerase III subunit delta [Clostridiales bacterium]|nr:DNA polymerase III subunit delta [Clostridiales bacterium]
MAKQAKSNWSTYKDVIMDAKKGNASRIYLFTGEEKYLIDRTVSSLKKQWISPGAESLDFYNKDMGQSELSISDFQNFVGSPPFMSKFRLTVIHNAGLWGPKAPSDSKTVDAWKEVFAAVPEWACVLFVEEKVDKRKKQMIDAVSQNGMLVDVAMLDEDTLEAWIRSRLEPQKIKISKDCMASLISRVDSSMRMIDNEITKLILYCQNTNTTTIDMKILEMLCLPDVHATVFNMTDAIGKKKPGQALELLEDLVRLKEPIPKIRLMLSRHIRHLICAKEIGSQEKLVEMLKLHPFAAKNLVAQSKNFTVEQLERIYNLCFESDQWVKTGKMDDRMSLEVLLAACGKV